MCLLFQVAHYGEKVYKCTICNDTFNSKKSMEAHIKSHSENASAPTPPPAVPSSESSCSSTSDKENKDGVLPRIAQSPLTSYESDIRYYLYTRGDRDRLSPPSFTYVPPSSYYPASGVELLAAAATATEQLHASSEVVFNLISKSPQEVRTSF